MKTLHLSEIQFVSGAAPIGGLFTLTLMGAGGYVGSSLAYLKPLMAHTITFGAVKTLETYSPNPFILVSGIMLGASMGYAIGEGLQQFYHAENAS